MYAEKKRSESDVEVEGIISDQPIHCQPLTLAAESYPSPSSSADKRDRGRRAEQSTEMMTCNEVGL